MEKIKDTYCCKQCGALVIINEDGSKKRSCEHNTTIILDLHVDVYGEGKITNAN